MDESAREQHAAPSVRHPERAAREELNKQAMHEREHLEGLPWQVALERDTFVHGAAALHERGGRNHAGHHVAPLHGEEVANAWLGPVRWQHACCGNVVAGNPWRAEGP